MQGKGYKIPHVQVNQIRVEEVRMPAKAQNTSLSSFVQYAFGIF